MPKKINVSVIGVTGYTGIELLRLLINHPAVTLKHLVSHSHKGVRISEVWPHFAGVCDIVLSSADIETVARESDVVFLALPHFEAQKIAKKIIGKTKIVDLSGDFRLKNFEHYEDFYGRAHEDRESAAEFLYGLPEKSKKEIAGAKNIANPGCFAITTELALLPLVDNIEHAEVLAVTGSSGAGKTLKEETHHPIRNHNMASYKLGRHQHIPEIAQTLGLNISQLSLVPTSGPFTRGIHLTAFLSLKKKINAAEVSLLFRKKYKDAPFMRLKKSVQLADVIGSNFCDIAIHELNGQLIVQAVIDNLVKGAAGTAIQNMNIMCGMPEETGLYTISPLFP